MHWNQKYLLKIDFTKKILFFSWTILCSVSNNFCCKKSKNSEWILKLNTQKKWSRNAKKTFCISMFYIFQIGKQITQLTLLMFSNQLFFFHIQVFYTLQLHEQFFLVVVKVVTLMQQLWCTLKIAGTLVK